jgi:DNA invertase Pin-like site-specific DNA recombinase
MNAIGYLRVSTEDQARGLSLESQRQAIATYAARKPDIVLCDWVSDHASGRSLRRRPGLQSALERLQTGEADALIVSRFDRFTRAARDFYDMLDRAKNEGWSLVCLEPELDMTTPHGRMFAGMVAVFAEFERELISQRQLESIAARKAAGTYKPPQPMVSPLTVERIIELRHDGLSGDKIAERLNLEGHAPLRADRWQGRTVRKIMARERIA